MSAEAPNSTKISSSPASGSPVVHKYRFPPFPSVPEGATIVPFKDYKEHGIQVFEAPDGVERDGLGIPTIPLRVKHDTDFSKTNPNRQRKTAKEMTAARPGFRKEWWEDWEEAESLRNHGPYNTNVAPVDRFHQAASDFQKYRKFPPIFTNVQMLWDQFRIFAGLLGTTPVWQKASEQAAQDDNVSDDDDFDEDEDKSKSANQGGPGEKRYPPRPRPRAPYELYGKTPVIVDGNDDVRSLLDAARATKEDKVVNFLENPARSIQIFLSSYMKYQGLMWSDRNLINTPHLLRFFVNYMLRNEVLPDKTSDRSLRHGVEIIDIASKELPLTAKISKVFPDAFSVACQNYWGRRETGSLELALDSDTDSVTGQPEAKRVKLNPDTDAAFESILKEENVELIKTVDVLPVEPASTPAEAPNTSETAAETGLATVGNSTNASWGSGVWGETAEYDPSSFTPPKNADDSWDSAAPEIDWAPPLGPSLLTLLGPTALPLTHTPGIVEWSVRRIKSITAPSAPTRAPPSAATGTDNAWEPDAEGVERELEAGMHRVVMVPWLGWDSPDADPALSMPQILRSSKGAIVAPDAPADTTPATSLGGLKAHNMRTDEITLLVDPTHVDMFCVGMGLGGTWVQLARMQDLVPAADTADGASGSENMNTKAKAKKSLTKTQKERRGLRYWYLDELATVLPSYWVA
ncbi:hypothetical protein C8R43DRAFT_99803 [Mycena crocata]|nr:hypothetical protein C8R43DRAFT_99803 [Mycena crocata]